MILHFLSGFLSMFKIDQYQTKKIRHLNIQDDMNKVFGDIETSYANIREEK